MGSSVVERSPRFVSADLDHRGGGVRSHDGMVGHRPKRLVDHGRSSSTIETICDESTVRRVVRNQRCPVRQERALLKNADDVPEESPSRLVHPALVAGLGERLAREPRGEPIDLLGHIDQCTCQWRRRVDVLVDGRLLMVGC